MAAGAPPALGDVLEPHGDEHGGTLPVGKGSDPAGAPAHLAVKPLDGVVGPDPPPAPLGNLV